MPPDRDTISEKARDGRGREAILEIPDQLFWRLNFNIVSTLLGGRLMKGFTTTLAGLIVLVAIIGLTATAQAAPIYWSGNGHYYERIENTSVNFEQAQAEVEGRSYLGVQGYLMTITSSAEQQFVNDNLLYTPFTSVMHYWTGAFQPSGSTEPNLGWTWLNGEVWSYINWDDGEPNENDVNGTENTIVLRNLPGREGQWNDYPGVLTSSGYFVEYPVPEPATLSLLAMGGLALLRRRKK